MPDLKRTPSSEKPPEYPSALEALHDRRGFLALAGKVAVVAAVPFFAASCMGAVAPDPVEPAPDAVEDVEGEFPPLAGDQALPDTVDGEDVPPTEDVEGEFPPLAGAMRMPDTVQNPDTK